jgi:hypothetical protein
MLVNGTAPHHEVRQNGPAVKRNPNVSDKSAFLKGYVFKIVLRDKR